ncbi:MAG: amino acid ABC transporter permease, partial [Cyanobacteriota bacterium]
MKPLLRRLRHELFATPGDAALSIGLLTVLALGLAGFVRWAFVQARWTVIQANSTLFAVGRYPVEQQWRLWLLTSLLVAATGLSWGLLRVHPRADREGVLWPRHDRLAVALLALAAVWFPWA